MLVQHQKSHFCSSVLAGFNGRTRNRTRFAAPIDHSFISLVNIHAESQSVWCSVWAAVASHRLDVTFCYQLRVGVNFFINQYYIKFQLKKCQSILWARKCAPKPVALPSPSSTGCRPLLIQHYQQGPEPFQLWAASQDRIPAVPRTQQVLYTYLEHLTTCLSCSI